MRFALFMLDEVDPTAKHYLRDRISDVDIDSVKGAFVERMRQRYRDADRTIVHAD
jgi:hypothetical protein